MVASWFQHLWRTQFFHRRGLFRLAHAVTEKWKSSSAPAQIVCVAMTEGGLIQGFQPPSPCCLDGPTWPLLKIYIGMCSNQEIDAAERWTDYGWLAAHGPIQSKHNERVLARQFCIGEASTAVYTG